MQRKRETRYLSKFLDSYHYLLCVLPIPVNFTSYFVIGPAVAPTNLRATAYERQSLLIQWVVRIHCVFYSGRRSNEMK